MGCQTSYTLGVGSGSGGGWHGLEMVALSLTRFLPRTTVDDSGALYLEWRGWGGVAFFLPGLSPRLLISLCLSHLPLSSLLLPVAEPLLGRARLSSLAAPPAGTHP